MRIVDALRLRWIVGDLGHVALGAGQPGTGERPALRLLGLSPLHQRLAGVAVGRLDDPPSFCLRVVRLIGELPTPAGTPQRPQLITQPQQGYGRVAPLGPRQAQVSDGRQAVVVRPIEGSDQRRVLPERREEKSRVSDPADSATWLFAKVMATTSLFSSPGLRSYSVDNCSAVTRG